MKSNFVTQTLIALIAWLSLENFNISDGRSRVLGSGKGTESYTPTNSIPIFKGQTSAIPPLSAYKIRKIVLDAGHGGKDPGCLGASSKEKDNTLAIILKLGALIQAEHPDITVIYTRDTDVFIELNERAAIANRNNADLFVSVHCNSIPSSRVSGTETYVLGVERAEHNLEVAKRENAVISLEENYQKNYGGYDPNSPEAHILSSVWQSAYLEQSILFASLVQGKAKELAEREDKGVKQAGFLVLRETAMPAVLIESGYLTNRDEEDYIASEEGQTQMATAIFQAFEAYKTKMEGVAPIAHRQAAAPKQAPIANKQREVPVTLVRPVEKKPVAVPASVTQPVDAFRILLLSWPNRLDRNSGQLSLLDDIKEERSDGKFFYYTGHYQNRAEADKMLPEIRNLGFKTAAVVPGK
jgi:N-acetylmuramoyl-L-alanine amidase